MTTSNPIQSSTNLFRRLTWQSSVLLSIRLADDTPKSGGIDRYYMQAPRYTYLPLLIPEIRENLVELALDDSQLDETNDGAWWFEEEPDDGALFASQGPCRWHWPLDLIELHSTISRPYFPSTAAGPSTTSLNTSQRPLRLILHLSGAPTEKLLLPNSLDVCKTQFLNQLKEADFVRWRNVNKVTSLRRADLEAGWDGIVQDDYDLYMRMAARLLPLPIPPATPSHPPGRAQTDQGSSAQAKTESSYSARALPLKIYLPDGAPVIQEVVPPLNSSGKPNTLLSVLRDYLPLLFPTSSSLSSGNPDGNPFSLAVPFAQGIELPYDGEIAWLSSCMSGVDGWLRIGIQLRAE